MWLCNKNTSNIILTSHWLIIWWMASLSQPLFLCITVCDAAHQTHSSNYHWLKRNTITLFSKNVFLVFSLMSSDCSASALCKLETPDSSLLLTVHSASLADSAATRERRCSHCHDRSFGGLQLWGQHGLQKLSVLRLCFLQSNHNCHTQHQMCPCTLVLWETLFFTWGGGGVKVTKKEKVTDSEH